MPVVKSGRSDSNRRTSASQTRRSNQAELRPAVVQSYAQHGSSRARARTSRSRPGSLRELPPGARGYIPPPVWATPPIGPTASLRDGNGHRSRRTESLPSVLCASRRASFAACGATRGGYCESASNTQRHSFCDSSCTMPAHHAGHLGETASDASGRRSDHIASRSARLLHVVTVDSAQDTSDIFRWAGHAREPSR
jgi:hypothetical protein